VAGGETTADAREVLNQLEAEMWEAAEKLEYERAALLRDQIDEWKKVNGLENQTEAKSAKPVTYRKKPASRRK
jgi:excinuclease ABC subunit B